MLVEQHLAGGEDVLRLGLEQADAADVRGEAVLAQGEHLLRRIGHGKQGGGGQVDALVGGLRRQHHGNQQLERSDVVEFRGRRGIGGLEPFEDFAAALLRRS
jgi:hypothetical protein